MDRGGPRTAKEWQVLAVSGPVLFVSLYRRRLEGPHSATTHPSSATVLLRYKLSQDWLLAGIHMAKKNKDDVPNVNSVANRDILHRLNFLYQASAYLDSISPPSLTHPAQPPAPGASSNLAGPSTPAKIPTTESSKKIKKRLKKEARGRNMQVTEIARSYVRSMKQIGEKTTVKM